MPQQPFAGGKFALGICDYCGQRYKLREMRPTYNMGKPTGFLACRQDWSPDHPMNKLPEVVARHGADSEALRNPRPEVNDDRTISGPDNWLDLLSNGVA